MPKFDSHVYLILRQRKRGFDAENDSSFDDQLDEMSREEALDELLAWELGSTGWLDIIKTKAESVGLELVERK